MRLLYLSCLLPLLSLIHAQDTSVDEVKQAFEDANIPEDLSITFNPTALLEVSLPQTDGSSITLHAGIQLPRNATAGPPSFSVEGLNCQGPFVVATVDPDAPTPQDPTNAQIRHFLGGDFTNEAGTLANSTPAITEFRQPTPPAGSPAHRYIFLLFRQSPDFDGQTLVNSSSPINLFDIADFAASTGLGDPIAGTFMLVAPDPTA